MQNYRPTLTFKPLIPFRPPCIFSPAPLQPHHVSRCFSIPLASSSPLWFSQGSLMECWGVSELGTLNYYILFHLIPLIIFVFRNLILIHVPLSGFLGFLLCDLIPSTPGLAFSLPIPCTLAASSFLSGMAYRSLSFLPPLFLRLTPIVIM